MHADIAVTRSEGATAGLLRFPLTSFTSPWFLGASEGDEITGIEVTTATTVFFFLSSMSLPPSDQLCPRKHFMQNTWQQVHARSPDFLSSFLRDALCVFFKDSYIE